MPIFKDDVLWQRYAKTMTLSAANTQTGSKYEFGSTILSPNNMAVELFKLEITIGDDPTEFVANTDYAQVALCVTESVTTFKPTNPRVLKYKTIRVYGPGTNGYDLVDEPFVLHLADDAGNGLLAVPDHLYLVATSGGLVTALELNTVLYFRSGKISKDMATEMMQAIFPYTT